MFYYFLLQIKLMCPPVPLSQDLSEALKKPLSGALEELLLGLLMTPAQFDAHRLREAMQVRGQGQTSGQRGEHGQTRHYGLCLS